MSTPIVFVEIDADSRLRVLQTDGVRLVIADLRVDPIATLWPEQDQFADILAAVLGLPLMSPGSDDPMQSALMAIRRVRTGLTIVADAAPIIRKSERTQ